MNIQELKKKLLKNRRLAREYERYDLAFEISEMVVDVRVKLGITQKQLAKKVGTKQPSIARLENGKTLPSLSFLEKIANKLGTYVIAPRFALLDERVVEDFAENFDTQLMVANIEGTIEGPTPTRTVGASFSAEDKLQQKELQYA